MTRTSRLQIPLIIVFVFCLLAGAVALWDNREAVSPTYTRFPLPNGFQQALLTCAAGYSYLERDPVPLSAVQYEAYEAASRDPAFGPLAIAVSHSLRSQWKHHFIAFCKAHNLWPRTESR
jgi:hypothetical protein